MPPFSPAVKDSAGNVIVPASPLDGMGGSGGQYYAAISKAYTAYAAPTDLVTIKGSDTKLVKVHALILRINVTAGALARMDFVKRSAANTGGTKAALTAIAMDSAAPAASAVVESYSGIPTALGAGSIIASAPILTTGLAAAPGMFSLYNSMAGIPLDKGVVLRGASECLSANWLGAALPSGFTAQIEVQWSEW